MRVIVPGDRVVVTNMLGPYPTDERPPYVGVPSRGLPSLFGFPEVIEHLSGGVSRDKSNEVLDQYLWKGGWPCE